MLNQYFDLLGLKVKDKVTGFTGVITCISFDLYGCVQVVIQPEMTKGKENEKYPDNRWFDVHRCLILTKKPVMERPNFERTAPKDPLKFDKGPADKPGV